MVRSKRAGDMEGANILGEKCDVTKTCKVVRRNPSRVVSSCKNPRCQLWGCREYGGEVVWGHTIVRTKGFRRYACTLLDWEFDVDRQRALHVVTSRATGSDLHTL